MKQLFKDTVKVNIDDIIPDPNNPNKMTKEQAKSLVYSMKKFDDVMPIVVDSKSMIIADGHHRLEAYKSMGVKEIEVIKKDFKNATERNGRRCFGIEIDQHYCDVVVNRWEEFTGQKAERITSQDD